MLSSNRYSKPWGHWFECQWLQKWDNSACIFFRKHVEKWAFNWSLCLADGTRGLIQGKIPLLQLVMGQWVSVARSEVRGRGAGLKNYRRTLCSLRQSKLHTNPLTWVTNNSESRYTSDILCVSFAFLDCEHSQNCRWAAQHLCRRTYDTKQPGKHDLSL